MPNSPPVAPRPSRPGWRPRSTPSSPHIVSLPGPRWSRGPWADSLFPWGREILSAGRCLPAATRLNGHTRFGTISQPSHERCYMAISGSVWAIEYPRKGFTGWQPHSFRSREPYCRVGAAGQADPSPPPDESSPARPRRLRRWRRQDISHLGQQGGQICGRRGPQPLCQQHFTGQAVTQDR